jgi:hypothetical protein
MSCHIRLRYYIDAMTSDRVSNAVYGFPHAELTIEATLPDLPVALPDLARLHEAEGRDTASLLAIVPHPAPVTISFDGTLTGRINGHRARPREGDRVRAVAYRRDSRDRYHGEFRIMMTELPNGEQLVLGRRACFRELG